jgi:mitochondrial fission protein ELM1
MKNGENLKVIIILSDGVRGHLNQSRGIAFWLSKMAGSEILEAEVPILTGAAKARARKCSAKLVGGNRRDARDWLVLADGDSVVRRIGQWFSERNIHEGSGEVLIISAGSIPAPYNLALGYIWSCACATVMTPSVVGTAPFDYAIIPEHDNPPRKPNVLVTLGSPNSVVKENLKKEAEKLLAEYPPESKEIWSILIGGDDNNYSITPEWIKKSVGHIMRIAEQEGVDLYITTSRRTSGQSSKTLKTLAARSSSVRYLLIASEDPFNPIPAMLGFSKEIFCTEDSVNMVSEAVTGGHRAVLLRVGHTRGLKNFLQKLTASLVSAGAIPPDMLWGIPKFDLVFEHFIRHEALIEFKDWLIKRRDTSISGDAQYECGMWDEFNEAKRAAQWIYDTWQHGK